MQDLQPYKNNLMSLSYEEKIQMSEWLHTQIDLERGQAVKDKAAKVSGQIGSFLDKAAKITKTAGNNLLDQFRSANENTSENKNTDITKK